MGASTGQSLIVASCDLANTGMPVGAVLAMALTLVLGGAVALVVFGLFGVRQRRGGRGSGGGSRRVRAGGALVLLLVVASVLGAAEGGGTAAQAAPSAAASAASAAASASAGAAADGCPGGNGGGGSADGGNAGVAENSLTIVQTSVNTGIVPGGAPTTLVGTITNHGTASVYITTVTVSIESVTKAPGAVRGACDASDYLLRDAAMPVGLTLAPEQTAEFSGASLAFSDKGSNQDACKSAALALHYRSS